MAETFTELDSGLRFGNPYATNLVQAAQQVEAQLAQGLVSDEVRREAEQYLADLAMLERLQEIRLERETAMKENHIDFAAVDDAYQKAFQDYGIDVAGAGAAVQIRERAIAVQLAAALDNWANVRKIRRTEQEISWQRLLEVAGEADPDPWRNALREKINRGHAKEEWEKLAAEARVEELPPSTVTLLGRALLEVNAARTAVLLLRRGQERHPADFWLNMDLAHALTEVQPPELDEAIGFYRVALGLRPESPACHLNLGIAFLDKGRLNEAIACFHEAIRLNKQFALRTTPSALPTRR